MVYLIEEQQTFIKEQLKQLNYMVDDVELLESSRRDLGQFQYNGIMALAKKYKKKPITIAEELVDKLNLNTYYYSDVNIAGPGFINITFSDNYLIDFMNKLSFDNNSIENKNPQKIIIDYGGPNIAKTLHVGHLRSANIGQALKNLSRYLGNEVISDVHLGDWGRQMGLVILELSHMHPEWVFFDENYDGEYPEKINLTNEDLETIYPLASSKAKQDEKYLEEARKITAKLQQKEKRYYELWKRIINVSVTEIKKIYDTLNVSFELWNGESDSQDYIDDVISFLDHKGLIYESEGALVMDVSQQTDKINIPPLLLKKSNGAFSYETTDLATIWERMLKYNPDEIWYVVDNRQSLHFEQVFRAAYKSGIVKKETKLNFIGFGTMNGPDGKPFKTRDGGVMNLTHLIDLIKEETLKQMNNNLKKSEQEQSAKEISIANLKYADLVPHRSTDYIFAPQKFSDANGKTGVYLLYSTIRIKSLLKKATESCIQFSKISKIVNHYDRELILELLKLPIILKKSYESKTLNEITNYLYQLTNLYNSFYSNNRILLEHNEQARESWLYLSKIILKTNEELLNILSIKIPEKI